MTADPTLHDAVARRLLDGGQRYTDGRRRLVSVLADMDRPVAMPELLRKIPEIPQSSAYRHLTVLASCNVVHRVAGTDDQGYFELTDELSGHHHHHVLCSSCGRVVDIAASSRLEGALIEAARFAAEETGFAIDAHRIELVGICADCRSAADSHNSVTTS